MTNAGPVHVDDALALAVGEARAAIEGAYLAGRPIAPQAASVNIWSIAFDHLLDADRLAAVRFALPSLREAFPGVPYFGTLVDIFAQLPEPQGETFRDDTGAAVQIVPSPGAETVVLAFTGLQKRLMLQLNLVHRWIAAQGVHVVYLRDHRRQLFLDGVAELAPDYAGTVAALARTVADLGARRICCLGPCQGGYAALRYALDLGAERVLAYSPLVHVAPQDVAMVMRRVAATGGTPASPQELASLDIKPALLCAAKPPALRIVVGGGNRNDMAQAAHLADLPGVTIEPLPGESGHNSLRASISAGRFGDDMAWLAARGVTA